MSHVILQNSTTSSSDSVGTPTGCSTSTHSKSAVVAATERPVGRSLSLTEVTGDVPSSLASFSAESTWKKADRHRQHCR